MLKLDYTLETPEERNELVKKILEENPEPNDKYLDIIKTIKGIGYRIDEE